MWGRGVGEGGGNWIDLELAGAAERLCLQVCGSAAYFVWLAETELLAFNIFIDSTGHSPDYTKRARNSGQSEGYLLVSLPWGDYFPIVMEDHPGLRAKIFEAVWAFREFAKRNFIMLVPESSPSNTYFRHKGHRQPCACVFDLS